MDQSLDVTNIKTETTDSTSSDQLEIPNQIKVESVKQESSYIINTKLSIKTEPHENEVEFPVIASTSYDLCSNYDMQIGTDERMIKIEYDNMLHGLMKDPLAVVDKIKDVEQFPIDLGLGDSKTKTEPIERENEANYLESDEDDSYSSGSNQCQELLIKNYSKHKDKKPMCHVCKKTFTQKRILERHLRIHVCEKPFACKICKKSFTRKGHLDRHVLIHSCKETHVCCVCTKVFSQKSYLDSHKLIHSGKKPFSCDECNKSFTHKHTLINHKRIHTGEKPFNCNLCDKTFTNYSNIIEHRRTHTGEKPYSCDICNKSFAQKSTLTEHKRLHTGEKPFSCDNCNKSFTQKSNLNQHKKIHKN